MRPVTKPLTKLTVIALLLGAVITTSSAQMKQDARLQPALQKARAVAEALIGKVRGMLLSELEKGSYAEAVSVCADKAQAIPQEINRDSGIYLRRVSLGWRNPQDKPDRYEQRRLKMFDQLNRKKTLAAEYYETTRENGREYLRYLKPLIAGPMCITCHGPKEKVPVEVREILARKYPDDRAFGYQTGDVRGAVSVKIELSPVKK